MVLLVGVEETIVLRSELLEEDVQMQRLDVMHQYLVVKIIRHLLVFHQSLEDNLTEH